MTNLYRARVVSTGIAGTPYLSTFYFTESGNTPSQVQAALVAYLDTLAPFVNDELDMSIEPYLDVLDDATGEMSGREAIAAYTKSGSALGEPLARATQGLIRLGTGNFVAGRELRGKIFVPGPTQTANNDGQTHADYRAGLEAAVAELMLEANGVVLRVWSKTHGISWAAEDASAWSEFAVLRSRRD